MKTITTTWLVVTRGTRKVKMTAEQKYMAGLRAGYLDESHGIIEPEQGYPMDEPYLAGVRAGREAWRRCVESALVVDRAPIGATT